MRYLIKTWKKYFVNPQPVIITDKKKLRSYYMSRVLIVLTMVLNVAVLIILIVQRFG